MALRKELQPNIETAVRLYSQVLEHLKAYQQFFSMLPRDAYNNVEALVHIHPFLDGNGRTARLLMNYIQAYYRLPLGLIFEEDKQSYYTALQSVQEHGDHEHYYAFMFAQYEKYLKGEINRANP